MRLGDNQLHCLIALRNHKGWDSRGCGWVWNTNSGTRRLLDTLVKRGLVDKKSLGQPRFGEEDFEYFVNRKGEEAIAILSHRT